MGYFLSSRDLAVDQVSRVLHTYPKGREFNDRSVPTAYSRYAIEVRVFKRHGIQGTALGINDVQMFGIV